MSDTRINMKFTVDWRGEAVFEAKPPSGATLRMDTHPDFGGSEGPTPMETLLAAAAACSGIDVVDILRKKRQKVTAYRIEVEAERTEEGVYPRPFRKVVLRHVLSGDDLDPDAVAQAVRLSDEKYCSVVATLRMAPSVESEWTVAEPIAP
ncbi:MAG: OsmC family protein [Fimbriimonadaceae bacterium]|nr:OsmC family protein [Fimbriimonadaceae bacterium]